MNPHGPTPKRRPLRGRALDVALDGALTAMLEEGRERAPIHVAAVARRLGLGSRTPLYRPGRLERITQAARAQQRTGDGGTVHRSEDERSARLQAEVLQLRRQLNELRGQLIKVAVNAHGLGLRPEELLEGLQVSTTPDVVADAEAVARQYLAALGLLQDLDPNVRALPR